MAFYRVLMAESRISSDKAPTYPVVNDLQRRNLYSCLCLQPVRMETWNAAEKSAVRGEKEEWQMLGEWTEKLIRNCGVMEGK